jgi:hypothetical protein
MFSKPKLLTAAALTLAGLGFACQKHQPNPPAVACRPAKPADSLPTLRSEGQPAETPLVEKLLPKETPPGRVDGERTADGFFKYEARRNIFVPVDHGHPRYTHGGQPVGLEHLIAEHGHARSSAGKWTRNEIETAHANSHFWEKSRASTRSPNVSQKSVSSNTSSCPNGVCGNPSRSRGLFGRRR